MLADLIALLAALVTSLSSPPPAGAARLTVAPYDHAHLDVCAYEPSYDCDPEPGADECAPYLCVLLPRL